VGAVKGLAPPSKPVRLSGHRVTSSGMAIRWGDERARVGPWRADRSVAFLVPTGPPPSLQFVRRCLDFLADQGFDKVITGALPPSEQRGFLEAGFVVHEHLQLLVLDLSLPLLPLPPGPRLHRAGRSRRNQLLAVDAACFSAFWRIDPAGLREVLRATEHHRLRVALGEGRLVSGYAICGASGRRGFVQRLAVSPASQGHGIGKKLLLDGLYWLRSCRVQEVAVNTQVGNDPALALYRRAGFRDDAAGVCVLSAELVRRRDG
jgi:GNAT superfamily N-acetyltransferase